MRFIEFNGDLALVADKIASFAIDKVDKDTLVFRLVGGFTKVIKTDSEEEAKKEYKRVRKIISSV